MSQDTVNQDQWARHHAAYGPQSWGAEATPAVQIEDDRAAFTQGWERPAFGGTVPPPPPLPPTPAKLLPGWAIAVFVLGAVLAVASFAGAVAITLTF